MQKEKLRFGLGILLIFLIIAYSASPQVRHIYALPAQMRVMQGESAAFQVQYPMTISVSANRDSSVALRESVGDWLSQPVFLQSVKSGQATLDFKLLGFIPFKKVQLDILPPLKIAPGGQSIGVIMHMPGVLVVGNSPVIDASGKAVDPAGEAGVQIGDMLMTINGRAVHKDIDVAELVDFYGKQREGIRVGLRRGQENMEFLIGPMYCRETNRCRMGLFVRDSAVGVGTLTFFDPSSLRYGALGHMIVDGDTNQEVECRAGKIVAAEVAGIQLGRAGQPGEKVGSFIEEETAIGNIEKNTRFGIYGKMERRQMNNLQPEPLEVASMYQIQEGPAEMMTVVEGEKVERFAIEIEKIHMQDVPESKGMVIKVTDSRLINKTGGIVQGMSGSPIIQNGKLVGAVTHVFVHDPTKGYACFMDWMLMESGLIPRKSAAAMPQLFAQAPY